MALLNLTTISELPKKVDNKKTYIILAVIVLFGSLAALDIWHIPNAWWIVLSALGLGGFRHAIAKVAVLLKELIEATNRNNSN